MKKSVKIATVNVMESCDGIPNHITSFTESREGNDEAESLFTKIIKENGAKKSDIESYIEDGIYTNGNYCAVLIHT